MEWMGRRVLVVGAGKSGIGAAKMLAACGASPVLFDENENVPFVNWQTSFPIVRKSRFARKSFRKQSEERSRLRF